MMIMRGNWNNSEKTLVECHFAHHESHMKLLFAVRSQHLAA
jgi:hypothetical protein